MSEVKTVEFTINSTSSATGTYQIELTENYNEATNTSDITVTAVRFKNSRITNYGFLKGILKLKGPDGAEKEVLHAMDSKGGVYVDIRTGSFYSISLTGANITVTTQSFARADDGSLPIQLLFYPSGSQSSFNIRSNNSIFFPVTEAKSVSFTQKPRASDIISLTPAAATLGNITLIVSPRKAGVKHRVSFICGGSTLFTSAFFDTSCSLTVPRAWFNAYPDTDTLTVTASVQTYNADETTLGAPVTATLTVTADSGMKPTVTSGWAVVSPYNTGAVSALSGYIQGHSRAQAVFDTTRITHANGAVLAGFSLTCLGETVSTAPYTTGILTVSATVLCTVTDSRGRTESETFTITVLPYSPPTISAVSIFRCDSSGTASEDGAYFSVTATLNISGLSGQNSGTLKTAFKLRGGSYGGDTTLSSGTAAVIGTANPDSAYIVRVTASDAVGETALYEVTVPVRAWAMKFRSGGMGVGFGKAPTQDNVLQLPAGWSIQIGDTALSEAQLMALLALI